jgi:LysM repeat protein
MLMILLALTLGVGLLVFWKNSKKQLTPLDAAHAPVTLVKAPGTAKPDDSLPLMAAVAAKPANQLAELSPTTKPADPKPAIAPEKTASSTQLPTMSAVGTTTTDSHTAQAGSTGDVFADAEAKLDAGDLLASRKILNDALLSGKLAGPQIDQAKEQLGTLNDQIVLSPRKFVNDQYAESYTVKSGDRLAKIAMKHEITTELLLRMNGMTDARKLRADQALKIVNGPFNAIVTKSAFTIDLYIGPPGEPGSMFVKQYKVALGRDDSTPPGTWMVETGKKQKNPKFWGSGPDHPPMEADDPMNPLGEYWIGLVGTDGQAVDKHGYGIHGTIDPSSIGKQASLGCIRLKNEDVAIVYELLVEGKSIVLVKP